MNTDDPAYYKRKYEELLSDYRELTGENLSVEARHVLNELDAARDWTLPETIADKLKVPVQRADFLLGRLVDSKHIHVKSVIPIKYKLSKKGSMAVHGTSAQHHETT